MAYWLATFRYMRAMARVNCTWAVYNKALEKVKAVKEPAAQQQAAREALLPIRRQLIGQVHQVYEHLLATVSTPGEMGTVANWDQHLLPGLLNKPGEELARLLGEALPDDAQPRKTYAGPLRVIVPTVRNVLGTREDLRLKVIFLSSAPHTEGVLRWRSLGDRRFKTIALQPLGRGVHSALIPREATGGMDFEYYVEARIAGSPTRAGSAVVFPPGAPEACQTVVVSD
jgi:hypothetical protein